MTSTIRSSERRIFAHYKHFLGAFWTLVDQGAISLGTFLLNIQLARHLAAPEYGIFALLLGGYFIIKHINSSLIYYPLMLRLAVGREERPTDLLFTSVALTAASSLVLSTAVAACLFAFGRRDIAAAAALYLMFSQLQEVFRRALLAEFRHQAAAAIDAITYLGAAAAIAVLAYFGNLNLFTALSAMAGTCALAVTMQIFQRRATLPSIICDRGLLRNFWTLGRWAFVSGLIFILSNQIFPWALAWFNGPAAAAGFQACLNIANVVNPIIFGLCNIILPAAALAHEEGSKQKSWQTARMYIMIGISLISLYAIPVILTPQTMLLLFYGANSPYAHLYHAVSIIVFAVAINSVADWVGEFINGVKAPKLVVWMNLISLAAAVLVLPWRGAVSIAGCAVALAVASTVRVIVAWYLVAGLLSSVNRLAWARPTGVITGKGQ